VETLGPRTRPISTALLIDASAIPLREVKKVFLSGFQDRIDEERIAVQDILDKAGIEGSY
jgi:hypothetical protein